jgi:enamine deaminase RidA (YjgF/YER057c/UK114 family)
MAEQFNPPTVAAPLHRYVHVVKVPSKTLVFVAGQIPVHPDGSFAGMAEGRRTRPVDLAAQVRQVYANLRECLQAAGADFKDVVKINTYVVATAFNEYRSLDINSIRREFMGDHMAPGTVIAVVALSPLEAMIEVEAIAALPE